MSRLNFSEKDSVSKFIRTNQFNSEEKIKNLNFDTKNTNDDAFSHIEIHTKETKEPPDNISLFPNIENPPDLQDLEEILLEDLKPEPNTSFDFNTPDNVQNENKISNPDNTVRFQQENTVLKILKFKDKQCLTDKDNKVLTDTGQYHKQKIKRPLKLQTMPDNTDTSPKPGTSADGHI